MSATMRRPAKPAFVPFEAVLKRLSLHEDVVRTPGKLVVDRDAGIIRHVKVLGYESINGRRYLREAVRKAKRLYERVKVCINHLKTPGDSRDTDDVFGRLINVAEEDDGLWADLEYLKAHPMAERICEAAERMPDLFGLSHNAEGDGTTDSQGVLIVSEIVDVRSVDVVAEPATTHGLSESRRRNVVKIKISKWLQEKLLPRVRGPHNKKFLTALVPLVEGKLPLVEMDEPGQAATAEDGLKMAMQAILNDDSLSADECAKRIKDLLKLKEKHAGMGEEEEDLAEAEEPTPDKPGSTDPSKATTVAKGKEGDSGNIEEEDETGKMKEEIDRLKRKDQARTLCEAVNRPDLVAGADGKVFLESLIRCPDEQAMKGLVDRELARPQGRPAQRPDTRPRSSAGGIPLTEGVDANGVPVKTEDRLNFLRNGGARSIFRN